MRRLFVQPLVLALLGACVDLTDPIALSRDDIRGTWTYTAAGQGCAISPTRIVISETSAFGNGYTFQGTWADEATPAFAFSQGEIDASTGSFLIVRSAGGPRVTLSGTMRADRTATATYSQEPCGSEQMTGVRQ